jgi:hypothetical protein
MVLCQAPPCHYTRISGLQRHWWRSGIHSKRLLDQSSSIPYSDPNGAATASLRMFSWGFVLRILIFFWCRIPPTRALSRFPLPPLPSKLHHLTIFTKTHRYPLMSIPSSRVLGSTVVFRRYECDCKMAIGCDFPLINWTTHRISMYVSACSCPSSLRRVLVII